MKTIKLLCGAAITGAVLMTSCGGGATVELKDRVDSLNYAFGAANGDGIRQYVIAADTTNASKLDQFTKGYSEAFGELEKSKQLEISATRFAQQFMSDVKGGVLFNDPTIPFNEDIFNENLEKGMRNESVMSAQDAMAYVQAAMYVALDSGAVRTQNQIDSINLAYAVFNASGARTHLLGKDTTAADIKNFMEGFENGKKQGAENAMYFEGLRIGLTMWQQLSASDVLMRDENLPVRSEVIKAGVIGAITQSGSLMTGKEAMDYFNAYIEGESAEKAKAETAEGEKFLEENKTKEGVIETASGLQYKVNVMGKGKKPVAENTVKVHYEGRLLDGKVFDSSIERGEPISFPLNGVIAGWTEGLQLMPIGSKFTFYIPYNLAYGERGAGADIPPYATLIFDVELLDIEK